MSNSDEAPRYVHLPRVREILRRVGRATPAELSRLTGHSTKELCTRLSQLTGNASNVRLVLNGKRLVIEYRYAPSAWTKYTGNTIELLEARVAWLEAEVARCGGQQHPEITLEAGVTPRAEPPSLDDLLGEPPAP